jgi:hypothetical protein
VFLFGVKCIQTEPRSGHGPAHRSQTHLYRSASAAYRHQWRMDKITCCVLPRCGLGRVLHGICLDLSRSFKPLSTGSYGITMCALSQVCTISAYTKRQNKCIPLTVQHMVVPFSQKKKKRKIVCTLLLPPCIG